MIPDSSSTDRPTAPLWRRLAALLYDGFILLALSFAYGAVATAIAAAIGLQSQDYRPMFHHWLFSLGWVVTLQGFYYGFWRKSGQTIGMRTWRIRLTDGANAAVLAGRGQCLVRLLLAPPLVLLGGLGYWYSLFDPRGDCLQDKLSRTRVVLMPKNH
jgi:uncharacterized RDD family membrane protein YckC